MMRLVNHLKAATFAVAVAALVVGCGPSAAVVPVEGTVTQGGRPLAGVAVIFVPTLDGPREAVRATGITDEQGRYTLVSDAGGPGVLAGTYRVCLIDTRSLTPPKFPMPEVMKKKLAESGADLSKMKSAPAPAPSRMPLAYNDAERTPIPPVELAPGNQVFVFDVPEQPKRGK